MEEIIFHIPKGITELERFVGFDASKTPINLKTGSNASVTVATTWTTFDNAVNSISKYPTVKGIGFVLGETDKGVICGIDIDNCIDENGNISTFAQYIIDYMDTYTEVSPSGRGIHILFYASKKGKKAKNANLSGCKVLEMYDNYRYFTMTGNRLNDKDIEHRQAECDYIYDNYIEPQQQEQKESRELAVLNVTAIDAENKKYLEIGLDKDEVLKLYYSGNRPYPDESANDNGFMSKLMYWCNNDIDLAVETFRNSPYSLLKDSKHDRKLDRSDYLRRTAESCWQEHTAIQNNTKKCYLVESKCNNTFRDDILEIFSMLGKKPHLYSKDDKGNSELYSEVFKDLLRYDSTSKQWRFYNGKYWEIDEEGLIASKYAKDLKDALLAYSLSDEINNSRMDEEGSKAVDAFRKHILTLGRKNVRDTMVRDAKDKFPIKRKDLDKDPYILNCQNGTLDLKTFEFKEHRASDLLSRITNVEYNPNATSPRWLKFIDDIMQGDKEKAEYLQKAIGYSLTGDTSCETFFILYGATTRNGKSTLIETIMYLLGGTKGYTTQATPETLAQKQNKDSRNASGDIARLDGARFLNVSEPPKNMICDVALLKTLTGRDTITARNVFEKEFEFIPVFKLFMNTNYLPRISDDTIFTSGRLNVIKFDRHFKPEEQDKSLKDTLKQSENLSGILNWCVEGLKKFNEDGLNPPQSVIDATQEYRENSDKVGIFVKECLEQSAENLSVKDVYEVYERWCKASGQGTENERNFRSELRTKNLIKDSATIHGKTVRNVICGYSIVEDWKYPHKAYNDIII